MEPHVLDAFETVPRSPYRNQAPEEGQLLDVNGPATCAAIGFTRARPPKRGTWVPIRVRAMVTAGEGWCARMDSAWAVLTWTGFGRTLASVRLIAPVTSLSPRTEEIPDGANGLAG